MTFSHVSALALTFETSSVFRAMGTVPAFFSASLWHVRRVLLEQRSFRYRR